MSAAGSASTSVASTAPAARSGSAGSASATGLGVERHRLGSAGSASGGLAPFRLAPATRSGSSGRLGFGTIRLAVPACSATRSGSADRFEHVVTSFELRVPARTLRLRAGSGSCSDTARQAPARAHGGLGGIGTGSGRAGRLRRFRLRPRLVRERGRLVQVGSGSSSGSGPGPSIRLETRAPRPPWPPPRGALAGGPSRRLRASAGVSARACASDDRLFGLGHVAQHGWARILGTGQRVGELVAEMRAASLPASRSLRIRLDVDRCLRLGPARRSCSTALGGRPACGDRMLAVPARRSSARRTEGEGPSAPRAHRRGTGAMRPRPSPRRAPAAPARNAP